MTSPMFPSRINLERISIQVIGQETLVYDELRHQAWSLNNVSACIWHLCDGQKTVEQIAAAAGAELAAPVTAEIVLLTLAELRERNLLDAETVTALPTGVSRREMLGRAGLAAALLLPIIDSVLTLPAHAQSGSLKGMAKPGNSTSSVEKPRNIG